MCIYASTQPALLKEIYFHSISSEQALSSSQVVCAIKNPESTFRSEVNDRLELDSPFRIHIDSATNQPSCHLDTSSPTAQTSFLTVHPALPDINNMQMRPKDQRWIASLSCGLPPETKKTPICYSVDPGEQGAGHNQIGSSVSRTLYPPDLKAEKHRENRLLPTFSEPYTQEPSCIEFFQLSLIVITDLNSDPILVTFVCSNIPSLFASTEYYANSLPAGGTIALESGKSKPSPTLYLYGRLFISYNVGLKCPPL